MCFGRTTNITAIKHVYTYAGANVPDPKTQSIIFKNRSILMKIQDGRQCLYSKKLNIHNSIYLKEQKYFIGMS